MENEKDFKTIYNQMLAMGINPIIFEQWLKEKNANGNAFGLPKSSTIYFCYENGRECEQYSPNCKVKAIRLASGLRFLILIGYGLLAKDAIAFAKEKNGSIVSLQEFLEISNRSKDIEQILLKCGGEAWQSKFFWVADGALTKDMFLCRLQDASVCFAENDDENSITGAVIIRI